MRFVPLTLLVAVLGCSAPSPLPDAGTDAGSLGTVCPAQHDETLLGAPVVVCDSAFDAPPYVHLPADSSAGGAEIVYGGIGSADGGTGLIARSRSFTSATIPAWADTEAQFGKLRYAYLLYRATVKGGAVQSVTPVVRVDDRVFGRLVAGQVFEGKASPRLVDPDAGTVTFDFDHRTTPIRLRLDPVPRDTQTDHSTGFPRFELRGHFENFSGPARSSTGVCLPSLASTGAANPFFGTDGGVSVLRYPAMHAPFDDVFTIAYDATGNVNMGVGLYLAPADLIQPAARAVTDGSNSPHGTPNAGPSADLTAVGPDAGAPCP